MFSLQPTLFSLPLTYSSPPPPTKPFPDQWPGYTALCNGCTQHYQLACAGGPHCTTYNMEVPQTMLPAVEYATSNHKSYLKVSAVLVKGGWTNIYSRLPTDILTGPAPLPRSAPKLNCTAVSITTIVSIQNTLYAS